MSSDRTIVGSPCSLCPGTMDDEGGEGSRYVCDVCETVVIPGPAGIGGAEA